VNDDQLQMLPNVTVLNKCRNDLLNRTSVLEFASLLVVRTHINVKK